MTINDLIKKYGLMKTDCWELSKNNKVIWIISHEACEKIAAIENIDIIDINILNSDWNFCRLVIKAKKDNKIITTIGEALLIDGEVLKKKTKSGNWILRGNCESQYIGCMAEKRGIDRAILKLINAYEYGIFSETENDEFKNSDNNNVDFNKLKKDVINLSLDLYDKLTPVAREYFEELEDNHDFNYTLEMYNRDMINLEKLKGEK